MNFQNDRYTLRFAESLDNDGMRRIFESEGFSGGISVKYLRNPKPFESFSAEGESKIMVISDNSENRIIAVGGAVLRDEFVGGKIEKCGYLTGIKIHPDYRGKIRFIAAAYRFLYENIKECGYFYTTVLDGNTAAAAMFEKKHRNMPLYRYIGHYTTYCFHGGKKILDIEKNNTDGFDEIFKNYFSAMNFVPADYKSRGFGKTDFYCIRKDGEIIACCFIGNQQENKQYKMCSYGGIYKAVSHLPTKLFGYPEFPKSGSEINYGTVSYLYIKDNNTRLCSDFLRSAAAETDFSLLIWGGFENNTLCNAMDKLKAVKYGSRLYSVEWEGKAEISGTIGIEAALL